MKIIDHLSGDDLDGFAHGHLDEYYDKRGNSTGKAMGFFSIDFDDASFADCPTRQRSPVNSCDPPREKWLRDERCDDLYIPLGSVCHEWDLNISYRVGLRVLPKDVTTIAELWDHLYDLTSRRLTLQVTINSKYKSYKGGGADGNDNIGDVKLTAHLGVLVYYTNPAVIGIIGQPVIPDEIELVLPQGKHLIGFPEQPANYERFSDLVVDGIASVKRRVRINGVLQSQYIYSEESAGDKVIEAGEACEIQVTDTVTFNFTAEVMQAPMARRVGTLATSWGAMKR